MQPEDRLDALLTALREPDSPHTHPTPADAALAPLIHAANEVATLHTITPDATYARDLRQRLLARASTLRAEGSSRAAPVAALPRRSAPTARGRASLWAGLAAAAALAVGLGTATAAAHAGPGTPLFGLHRLEQGIQVAATNDSASRVSCGAKS